MESSRFCSECGAAIQPSGKFCASCGKSILPTPNTTKIEQEKVLPTPNESIVKQPNAPTETESPIRESPASTKNHSLAKGIFSNGIFFFFSYLIVAIPTYVLPYFGSNSAVLNTIGTAVVTGALPQAWYHLLALYLLVAIAWLRGALVGRQWLAVFPVFAAIFDMVPGFNVIPLIPSVFHILAIVLGLSVKLVSGDVAGLERNRLIIAAIGLLVMSAVTVFKAQTYYNAILPKSSSLQPSISTQSNQNTSFSRNTQQSSNSADQVSVTQSNQQKLDPEKTQRNDTKPNFINVDLEQKDDWKLHIRVSSLSLGNIGTFEFRSLNCGGNLQYEREQDNGYLFQEKLSYGNCVPGCWLWLNTQGTFYKEICDSRVTGSGSLISSKSSSFQPSIPKPSNTHTSTEESKDIKHFIGSWKGDVKQPGSQNYSTTMTVHPTDGSSLSAKIDYPELKCGGKLKLIKVNGSRISFLENITYGENNCIDGGKIQADFTKESHGEILRWAWFYPDGRSGATAILSKNN